MVPGTTASSIPNTLCARAAIRLAAGPLDVLTLMREVCRLKRLQHDAAERMAVALLGSRPEFVQTPAGHWALATTLVPAEGEPHSEGVRPSLFDLSFSVVDVETTGSSPSLGDRITEIAVVEVKQGKVAELYSQLVNPERPIPSFITALTGISCELVRHQPTFREVLPAVLERLRGSIFVAHNVSFDWRFVNEELRRCRCQELSGPRLCTARLARATLPGLSRRSLDRVSRYLGIEIESRHRAAGDAAATARALCLMLGMVAEAGVDTWERLQAFVDGGGTRSSGHPRAGRSGLPPFLPRP